MTRFMLEVGQATDIGKQRERNEDFCASYLRQPGEPSDLVGLLLVADGMGGERGGARASRLAVERVLEEVSSEVSHSPPDGTLPSSLAEIVRRVIRETSDRILELGKSDPAARSMGSTLVMTAVYGEGALIAHVGDSRCYRVRRGRIERLTNDHTWVTTQVEAGILTAEEARQHPQRNVLTRTLGDMISPGVDVRTEGVEDEDLFILCTDGLTNALADGEILEISDRFSKPQDLAEALVALASDQDGSDNATAMVCRCRDFRPSQADPEATEPILRPGALGRGALVRKRWIALGVLAALLLAGAVFGPRILAARAFDRGVERARNDQYLHALEEFSTAIRLGLDAKRTEELIDWLLAFPSEGRLDGTPAETPPTRGEEPPPDERRQR